MILDWDQLGYWRFRIELQTIEAIPLIGPELRDIITGGGAINSETVEHLYTLHSYVVSTGAVVLAVIHLWSLVQQEKEQKMALAVVPSVPDQDVEQKEAKLVQTR
jgi:cytochrome b6